MRPADALRLLAERRLEAWLRGRPRPRHVGLVMDGNRRWARGMGFADAGIGHRYGAAHAGRVLGWCRDLGIAQVTLFVASTDNIVSRESAEIDHLMRMVEEVTARELADPASPWRVHLAGRLDMLPASCARALKEAEELTRDRPPGADVTVAIGYGGRDEIVDAVRSLLSDAARAGESLHDVAARVTDRDIAARLYTAGTPDPDLVIRTSGERRLSGFLLWQSTHAELQFCDTYWPGFRRIDLLRALRAYALRRSRVS
ncbi:di-trans,poly-cis-decaprenylcistransferase [Pseudonocardia sp. CNS-139]|nr:di-trans,poly-cis-decaprenylcistransferase [Pseudonocardia sp. CNS-139]